MKVKYIKEDGALNLDFGSYNIYLNHPVVFISNANNEFEEKETRIKLAFGIGFHYNSNKYLNYFYIGFLILGFGIGFSKQNVEQIV